MLTRRLKDIIGVCIYLCPRRVTIVLLHLFGAITTHLRERRTTGRRRRCGSWRRRQHHHERDALRSERRPRLTYRRRRPSAVTLRHDSLLVWRRRWWRRRRWWWRRRRRRWWRRWRRRSRRLGRRWRHVRVGVGVLTWNHRGWSRHRCEGAPIRHARETSLDLALNQPSVHPNQRRSARSQSPICAIHLIWLLVSLSWPRYLDKCFS